MASNDENKAFMNTEYVHEGHPRTYKTLFF
jgi:hypothetical protein